MPSLDIPFERLLRQRMLGAGLESPADAVRWMGAVQAQDFAAGKWAIALRTRASTDADLEHAFTAGTILRTHVMRPTWHFVLPEDIRWLQALTAPRVNALNAYQYRRLELDAALFKRSRAVFIKALRGGRQLTRLELAAELARAGIVASGLRLTYIFFRAELDAVICSGGRRGKQFTYALLDERAPNAATLRRDEALAELALRYFTSHGPASLRDFAWWSGLAAADVRTGLEAVRSKLMEEVVDRRSYWMTASRPPARRSSPAIYLLANYDEYIVGYTDRSAIFDQSHARGLDARHNPLFTHTIVSGGRIVGTWKRTLGKASVRIESHLFDPPTRSEERALEAAQRRYASFLELELEKS